MASRDRLQSSGTSLHSLKSDARETRNCFFKSGSISSIIRGSRVKLCYRGSFSGPKPIRDSQNRATKLEASTLSYKKSVIFLIQESLYLFPSGYISLPFSHFSRTEGQPNAKNPSPGSAPFHAVYLSSVRTCGALDGNSELNPRRARESVGKGLGQYKFRRLSLPRYAMVW